jgi:hypothetical protein
MMPCDFQDSLQRISVAPKDNAPAPMGRPHTSQGATPGMRPDPFAASCRDAAWRRVSGGDALVCGVPSERTGVAWRIPKALPWAGMRRPHGAEGATCCWAMRRVNLAKMCQTIFLPDQEFCNAVNQGWADASNRIVSCAFQGRFRWRDAASQRRPTGRTHEVLWRAVPCYRCAMGSTVCG